LTRVVGVFVRSFSAVESPSERLLQADVFGFAAAESDLSLQT
jgi:hypothetical protein